MYTSHDPVVTTPRAHWGRAPLVRVLVAQAVGAFFAFFGAFAAAAWFGMTAPLFLVLVTQGIIAARLGERLFHLPRWWIQIGRAHV